MLSVTVRYKLAKMYTEWFDFYGHWNLLFMIWKNNPQKGIEMSFLDISYNYFKKKFS